MSDSMRITRGSAAKLIEGTSSKSIHYSEIQSSSGIQPQNRDEQSEEQNRDEQSEEQNRDKQSEDHQTDKEGTDFCLKKLPTQAPRMCCIINSNITEDLSTILPKHVFKVFCESTCFEHYMRMHNCYAQAQVHRCLMSLELNCSSRQAFTIRVNGTILRFTIRDFAIITGLNCVGEEEDFKFDTQEPNRLMEEYFEDPNCVRK